MEQNEKRQYNNPIFVEPEAVEDIPLSRYERMKEAARNVRRKIRFPKIGTVLAAASVLLLLLALIAAPILPVAALLMLLAKCCRSAFRAQTA